MTDKIESPILLDCSLRDGGYYTNWDFAEDLVSKYLLAMSAAKIDVVELGFRFLENKGFKGPYAFTSDKFIRRLSIPENISIGVMINGKELNSKLGYLSVLERLFPDTPEGSPVQYVRIACHQEDLEQALPSVEWLKDRGFKVGINLMQIADYDKKSLIEVSSSLSQYPITVLYFADSTGSITPKMTTEIINTIRGGWDGAIGIHAHDNMGLALSNTLSAYSCGATWLDATVTGIGRGPGNTKIEELIIEVEILKSRNANMLPLLTLIQKYFDSMRIHYGWGTNPFYYLAGKFGIHPSYIQEMLNDTRYEVEDIFAVINHLQEEGAKSFNFTSLSNAREDYKSTSKGNWSPADVMKGRDVLILGNGPGLSVHRAAIESYIKDHQPIVIALNASEVLDEKFIDYRAACHPIRIRADVDVHVKLSQPLITPLAALPSSLDNTLYHKLLDFGLSIKSDHFEFNDTCCVVPVSLALAYALAITASGQASSVFLAGLDGFSSGDPRNDEIELMLKTFLTSDTKLTPISITPTLYKNLKVMSVYGL